MGTKEDCEAKVAELNLPLAANNSLGEIEQEVVVVPYLDDYIEFFS